MIGGVFIMIYFIAVIQVGCVVLFLILSCLNCNLPNVQDIRYRTIGKFKLRFFYLTLNQG